MIIYGAWRSDFFNISGSLFVEKKRRRHARQRSRTIHVHDQRHRRDDRRLWKRTRGGSLYVERRQRLAQHLDGFTIYA